MSKQEILSAINLEKKQSFYGLFQDLYTLIYCIILIPISLFNIMTNTNIIGWNIDLFSYIYFIITGAINLYYLEYNFVLHHLICINLIWIGYYNNNLDYFIWLSYCYLAEISNIFLSLKNILKHLRYYNIIKSKKYENINDIFFASSYILVRIFFILPYTCAYIYQRYMDVVRLKYLNFITLNIILMSVLNCYWFYLITKKIIRTVSKKSN
jgi:hypothetical protein